MERGRPGGIATKVSAEYPTVTAAQVRGTWRKMSEIYWRRDIDNDQIQSAFKLLSEFSDDAADIFEPQNVADGVQIMCWGLKKIARPQAGKIVEIATDATRESTFRVAYVSLNAAQMGLMPGF